MFLRRSPDRPARELFEQRLKLLVRDRRDQPGGQEAMAQNVTGVEQDLIALLVELRTAAKRGSVPAAAEKIGVEFAHYLREFYSLPAELQPLAIQALLESSHQEQDQDFDSAIQACEEALNACPNYPALLERLANLETARGKVSNAELWYSRLLRELDRLRLDSRALEICHQLVATGVSDVELLDQCGRRLEAGGDLALAAECSSARASRLLEADQAIDALRELDRAINLQPHDARLLLELASLYERLEEPERATGALAQAEALATNDPDTLGKVLLIQARVGRPSEMALGRLMDLLDTQPESRATRLRECDGAIAESPYNPHLRYMQGVLLAQDGQAEQGITSLRLAADRYSAQSDLDSELEARLAIDQLAPDDAENRRRIAELHFNRGEVHQAMQTLASLAQVARVKSANPRS